jgi:hypothetical protein
MRKLCTLIALGALAAGLVAAPGAIGKKSPKQVPASVTLTATPSTLGATATTVTVSGNVQATSSCRKDRTVRFSYTGAAGTTDTGATTVTRSNGDFTAVLTKPADVAPATVTLTATVDAADRKVGSKKKGKKSKKGRKINCLSATGSTPLTITP